MESAQRDMDQNKKNDGGNAFKGLQDLLKVEEAVINALNKFIGIPEGIRSQMPEVAEMLGRLVDELGDVTAQKVQSAMGSAGVDDASALEEVEPPIEPVGGEGYEIEQTPDPMAMEQEAPIGGMETGGEAPIEGGLGSGGSELESTGY